jgi:hypothetical protein
VEHLAREKTGERWAAYAGVRYTGVRELVDEYVLPSFGLSDGTFKGLWPDVEEAIEFRNLVVHEATYLNGGHRDRLTAAVVQMFEKLGEISRAAPDATDEEE